MSNNEPKCCVIAIELYINVDEVIKRVIGDIDGVWWIYIGGHVMNKSGAANSAAVIRYCMMNLAIVK